MIRYLTKRVLSVFLVLLTVSIVTFSLTNLSSADPASQWAGQRPTAEQIKAAREELGLDLPFYQRYFVYMRSLVGGDLGTSIRTRQPVLEDMKTYFPATLELVTVSIVLSLGVGIPLGIASAVRRNGVIDQIGRILAIAGVALPVFWLGMMLQLFVTSTGAGLPLQGRLATEVARTSPIVTVTGLNLVDAVISGNLPALKSALVHLILPAITQALGTLALIMRMTRSSMLEVLRTEYIRSARAYGVSERVLRYKYALKNALIPIITIIGLAYGNALGGSILVENIFDWPGIGRYVWLSILANDYTAIMGVTIIFAATYILINLAVDLAYAAVDPRVRVYSK
jgi:peptide/nickel transport system permease protein